MRNKVIMAKKLAIQLWQRMDDPQRILLCKLMTETAMELAKTSAPNLSEAFLQLARAWSLLGTQVSLETARRESD